MRTFCLVIIGVIFMTLPPSSRAQSSQPFVAADFAVPEKLETERFRQRMLTVNAAIQEPSLPR